MDIRFQSEMQNFVNQVDSGPGRRFIHWLLLVFFAFSAAALFLFLRFHGLSSPDAFDEAQLARNLAATGRWETDFVRPFDAGVLSPDPSSLPEGETPEKLDIHAMPETRRAPLHPALLSLVFRATGLPKTGEPVEKAVYPWDWVPALSNAFLAALAGFWILALGRALFDNRVAALSAASWFLLAGVWEEALASGGTVLALNFTCLAALFAIWSDGARSAVSRALCTVAAALAAAGAFYASYLHGFAAVALALYFWTAPRPGSWKAALGFLALFLAACAPWCVRNAALTGNIFGLAPYATLAGTYLFPDETLTRSFRPALFSFLPLLHAVQAKASLALRESAAAGFGLGGLGLYGAAYVLSHLHRFHRATSQRLRFCLLPWAVFALLAAAALRTPDAGGMSRALLPLWPFALVYAWAFILLELDRIPFAHPATAPLVVAVLFAIGALSYVFAVMPPRDRGPYPTYYHNSVAWAASRVGADEAIASDMPWATAWYGDRTSVFLPRTLDAFRRFGEEIAPVQAAYFTLLTRDKPWTRGLADPSAPDHDWYRIFSEGCVPRDFPLKEAHVFFGSDQMMLVDRPRW